MSPLKTIWPQPKTYFPELAAFRIDIEQAAGQLENEGVKLFADSFDSLLKDIREKKNSMAS